MSAPALSTNAVRIYHRVTSSKAGSTTHAAVTSDKTLCGKPMIATMDTSWTPRDAFWWEPASALMVLDCVRCQRSVAVRKGRAQ